MTREISPREVSLGECHLCGGTFSRRAMAKHLNACRETHPGSSPGRHRERTARIFLLVVEGHNLPQYWMYLEVAADAALTHLDGFLRRIWLECCGHLSAFTIGSETFEMAPGGLSDTNADVTLAEVLGMGAVFYHEYDFGTTTKLRLQVSGERESVVKGGAVQLLARNNPPAISCSECGKPATQVCSECDGWLCDTCAASHECGDEMLLPVVNSPRVGMCGYTGPGD
ncbi:MAG: hypothetical protein HYX90_09150 [Chloroflexi bacterium]|nr:hypothetical protein [Chloroflexota bacterium]